MATTSRRCAAKPDGGPWNEVVKGTAPERVAVGAEWPAGSWEARVRSYVTEDGDSIEGYGIGALGMALNRRPVTIRRLERRGLLPPAPFRSAPIIDTAAKTVIRTGQRRLYTYEGTVALGANRTILHRRATAIRCANRSGRPISVGANRPFRTPPRTGRRRVGSTQQCRRE
jgi:hypothetical protein